MPESCDLLIEAGHVVPVEPHGVVLAQHAVAVTSGRIVAVLPIEAARARFAPKESLSRPRHVLFPGLVNTHCHAAMTVMRGIADDLPLMRWLSEHIWPTEAAFVGPEFVRDGIRLAAAEMLRGGVTTVNDMYFFPDVAAQAFIQAGMRAAIGLIVIEFPSAWARSTPEYFDKALAVQDEYRDHPNLRFCFAPHAPYTVSDASFERIRMLSDQLDLPVHVHVHETAFEVDDAVQKHNERPLARLKRLGLVNPNLIAVHMTQLTDAEIELVGEHGVSIAHCPESNLKLASGFAPIEELRRAGANVAIGTDGCASNNDLDMIGETRTAALLAKGVANDAAAIDAATALRMATLNGARAIGMDQNIGSIEVGKAADLVLLDLGRFDLQPVYSAISQIIYTGNRRDVTDVFVGGEARVRDGVLCDVDIDALSALAARWGARIAGGAGSAP